MPATISIVLPNRQVVAQQTFNAYLLVEDKDSSGPYTLQTASVNEVTESDFQIGAIQCSAPNSPPGTGKIVVPLNGSAALPFSLVSMSPVGAGPSAQYQPGGAAPNNVANFADATFVLQGNLTYTTSGGATVAVTTVGPTLVPVLSEQTPDTSFQGAMILSQGGNFLTYYSLYLL
mgnify:CR=1 FL=1